MNEKGLTGNELADGERLRITPACRQAGITDYDNTLRYEG